MKYWKHITLAYLTEESDDPDNPNGIIEHKIPWRSQGKIYIKKNMVKVKYYNIYIELNEFMMKLEKRASKRQPQPVGLVAKKVRYSGDASNSEPPTDAPVWAVKQQHSK